MSRASTKPTKTSKTSAPRTASTSPTSPTAPDVLLQHHLKALRLPTFAAEAGKVAAQCAADNVDHLGFLLRCSELELLEREQRAKVRRLKAAKFPTQKTLETFDFAAVPSLNRARVQELLSGAYLERRENILLLGPPGTGKTHLATALAIAACGQGRKVRFWRVTELVTALLEARDGRVLQRLKQQLAKLDLLVCDELGYVPATKVGAELLFDVISSAYERTSVLLTSNLPFEEWTQVLGSERLTGATLDRLTHRCHILELNGESYRLREARRRGGQRPPAEGGASATSAGAPAAGGEEATDA
jgi:DNA replication protein DnaC